jgi:hypothetical protein
MLRAIAARAQDSDMRRYSPRMGEAVRDHWRKSSQWFGLTRKHAVLVTSDTLFLDIFRQHCWSGWDGDVGRRAHMHACMHHPTVLPACANASLLPARLCLHAAGLHAILASMTWTERACVCR